MESRFMFNKYTFSLYIFTFSCCDNYVLYFYFGVKSLGLNDSLHLNIRIIYIKRKYTYTPQHRHLSYREVCFSYFQRNGVAVDVTKILVHWIVKSSR